MEKTLISFFSTYGSKINEFERKKSEKNEKVPKTQKLQEITLTSNSHHASGVLYFLLVCEPGHRKLSFTLSNVYTQE